MDISIKRNFETGEINPVWKRVVEYLVIAFIVGVFFFVASVIVLFAASLFMFIVTGVGLKEIVDMPFKVGGLAFVLTVVMQTITDLME